mmetsp:Transcript_41540/g.30541  ORF Transcript_41540/g.30541 Transcript_41540/m.30541 type:complete len:93 (+) Transcript_41540:89-367(+)
MKYFASLIEKSMSKVRDYQREQSSQNNTTSREASNDADKYGLKESEKIDLFRRDPKEREKDQRFEEVFNIPMPRKKTASHVMKQPTRVTIRA